MITLRPSAERGHGNYGWLDTRYSFSFANYLDRKHMGFRDLRVINEDWIAAGQGFGSHPHQDMEIITYIVQGELSHRDSTGREATIKPNDVQRMSAGTGVVHSEYNNSAAPVHLLQIWIMPEANGLPASYEDRTFAREEKLNQLRLIGSHDGQDGSTKINQDASVYASVLDNGKSLEHEFAPGRHAWLQVISGELDVNGAKLTKGDGAAVSEESRLRIVNTSDAPAEFLLFDLN
ncbi:MAG: pirin family protein [Candidatus Korobacteraceae bacterium]